jgi:hypothetical protein
VSAGAAMSFLFETFMVPPMVEMGAASRRRMNAG